MPENESMEIWEAIEQNIDPSTIEQNQNKEPEKEIWEQVIESEKQEEEGGNENGNQESNQESNQEPLTHESLGFKAPEEVYSSYKEMKEKLDAIQKEKDELVVLKSELEEKTKSTSYIDDENFLRLSVAKSKNDPNFNTYKNILFSDSVSDIELVKMKVLEEMPELKDDQKLLDKYIKKTYGLTEAPDTDDPDYEEWEENNKFAMIKIKGEAKKYKKNVEDKFNSIELPNIQRKETEQEIMLAKTKAKTSWQPYINDIVERVTSFETDLDIFDEPIKISYKPSSDLKKKYADEYLTFLSENRIPLNESSGATLGQFQMAFRAQHINDIMKEVVKTALEKYDDALASKKNNINYGNRSQSPKNNGKDDFEEQFAKVLKSIKR